MGINRYKTIINYDCSSLDFVNDSNDQHFGFSKDEKILNNIILH